MIRRMLVRMARRRLMAAAVSAAVVALVPIGVYRSGTFTLPSVGSVSSPAGGSLVIAAGPGWTAGGLDGPVPAPRSCHFRHTATGQLLPDPACTPGAIDQAVTQGTLSATICRPGGYTSSVRPPVRLTEPIKRRLMAAYGLPWSLASQYELDHLVELNAGGASDVRNLWPQPNVFAAGSGQARSAFVHNDKDAIEAYTFHAICRHQVSLTAVQHAIANNWTTAVAVMGLSPIPKGYRG
ncbi:MAG: hypothetical protein ABIP57_18605 [Jatrophihabitantaceae bacterium]